MPFTCPECSRPDYLMVTAMIELPPDEWSDEIEVEIVECSGCKFRGVAVDEESRRGALDSECTRHVVYRVTEEEFESLRDAIKRCPDPANRGCKCPHHRSVAQALAWGEELRGANWHHRFRMEPAL
jgi:hypothetical protein